MTEAQDRLYWMISGYRMAELIRTAVIFGLCDLLASGPRQASDIAGAAGLDPGLVRRLMRALVGIGVLVEQEDGSFSNSQMGELLRKDVPDSALPVALTLTGAYWLEAWRALPWAMKEKRVPFQVAHGRSYWEVLAGDGEAAENFNRMMAAQTETFVPQLLAAYDFSRCRQLVDVGGGNGALVGAVLAAHPAVRGILFDLAAGLEGAEDHLIRLGVRDRCELVAGSFFESVWSGGDVYMLRQILHDWDDERAAQILTSCRRAMSPGATLLVMDRILPARATDSPQHRFDLIIDMHMHVLFGARERSEAEQRDLLEMSGFAVEKVVTASPQPITIATAV